MASINDQLREMFGQQIAIYSQTTGNYEILRETEIYLSLIPALLEVCERSEEYADEIAQLETLYAKAINAIDDRNGWKYARQILRDIRKRCLTIALKEELVILRRDMLTSIRDLNTQLIEEIEEE